MVANKRRGFQTAPGQYDPMMEYTKMKAAGWRIGSEKRPGMVKKGHEVLPGPIYEIPSKMVEGPKCHMHAKTDKVDQNMKKNYPAPGAYDLQNSPNTRHKKAAAFSLGTSQRADLAGHKESKQKPGPGNYENMKDMKRTAPRFGFGSSQRPQIGKTKFETPGPGSYA